MLVPLLTYDTPCHYLVLVLGLVMTTCAGARYRHPAPLPGATIPCPVPALSPGARSQCGHSVPLPAAVAR